MRAASCWNATTKFGRTALKRLANHTNSCNVLRLQVVLVQRLTAPVSNSTVHNTTQHNRALLCREIKVSASQGEKSPHTYATMANEATLDKRCALNCLVFDVASAGRLKLRRCTLRRATSTDFMTHSTTERLLRPTGQFNTEYCPVGLFRMATIQGATASVYAH